MGHMRDRAVLLADLLTDRQRLDRSSVAVVGEDLSQYLRRREVGVGSGYGREALLDEAHPLVGEGTDRVVSRRLGEEAECLDREVVVLLLEAAATQVGQNELLGGTPSAPHRGSPDVAGLDGAIGQQLIQMATDRGWGQIKTIRKGGCRRRAVDMDGPHDALTRRTIGIRHFHNDSVALFGAALKEGHPYLPRALSWTH